jgi:hypothetical protein
VSDRKYRQRGYQDDSRDREPKRDNPAAPPPAQRAPGRQLQDERGPKTPNLMASHEVFRCSRCGNRLATPVELDVKCSRCGVDLHSCIQCASFDTSARFECSQEALTARVSPKDAKNACALFAARTTIERQTSSPTSGSNTSGGALQAFDDLFKL